MVTAQPDFNNVEVHEGVRCFRDIRKQDMAYYAPGKLKIKQDQNGKPDFNFLETRYTGNAAYGDRGENRFLSYIRFRVVMERMPADKLLRLKRELWSGGSGHLRPAPVTDVQTMLVYTSVSGPDVNSDTLAFTNGNLSAESPEGLNGKGQYWKEREFSVRLDNYSAQILSKAFQAGQTVMSLSYAFFSEGVEGKEEKILTEGENKILEDIERKIKELKDADTTIIRKCIASDAFSVVIDTKKWPGLIKKIDINEQVPPGYAALEVRCYDFHDNLRPDLFAKKIEIKAEGVGRGYVIVKKTFNKKYPDIYVYDIRFPYAVRLDRPLYYRVTSISDSSAPVKTDWIRQDSWTGMIDITSTEDQIIENEENN